MKVNELIQELLEYNQDMEVLILEKGEENSYYRIRPHCILEIGLVCITGIKGDKWYYEKEYVEEYIEGKLDKKVFVPSDEECLVIGKW